MKLQKYKPLLRGVAATAAALLTLSTVAYGVAKSDLAIGWVDGFFGINDRTIYEDRVENVPGYTIPGATEGYSYLKGVNYTKEHNTVKEYAAALREHAIKQGEEGFALLKNDNDALPLNKSDAGEVVALFGWNAYNMPSGHTGVVANNGWNSRWGGPSTPSETDIYPQITLKGAFDNIDGVTVNNTVIAGHFTGAMTSPSRGGGWGGGGGTPWNEWEYTIPEVAPDDSIANGWTIAKDKTTGIVVLGRGGGEGNNFKVDAATNAEDPLALSPDELKIVKLAKDKCAKVVVLIVSANAMELGPLVEEGGEYEVDAIGFCGIPNDFQYQGIANVLAGKVNATGGLTDTYVYDNSFTPASINMGQQQYSDLDTITSFNDPLGRSNVNYYANNYIVEAEGIYVGYKYYETRYFDSVMDPEGTKATSATGSTTGEAWDYATEVVFPFGQSLSYIPYTQELTEVRVNNSELGEVTATIKVTNESETEDGYFLAQLYVNRPYTEYDSEHNVEKSAIDFLNSKKVEVKAGQSKEVEITVPTRYLASWDSSALNGEGTYVLDEGDYLFTAAAGSHAAVNNIINYLGKETDGTTTLGEVEKWNLEEFDDETFSVSNGVEVRNQMENADINYFLGEDTVTYLSRDDWEGTFPKNYTDYVNDTGIQSEPKFTIKGAEKEEEWLTELISAQYKVTPSTNEDEWVKVEGTLPATVADGTFASVWDYILDMARNKPEAFSNIHSDEWQAVAAAIPLGTAIASVPQGGHATQTFPGIGNPGSVQSESVSGYQQTLKLNEDGTETMKLNVASNTLLGSSFNPDFAYEWGLLEDEGGLWLQETESPSEYSANAVTVWGAGLNQHRHAYNGRNSEYMSEDPMLTNRIGEAQLRGAVEKGSICGPKHMGFNDQELNREGNACYMTEQKVRETDTRCYEGALRVDEGNGTGVMMSFARIGATNCTNSVGYINNIMRGEWGFTGIITTDMGKGAGYHEAGALIMASVNEYAGFGTNPFYMVDANGNESSADDAIVSNTWKYITLGDARKDPAFANQARQTALYVLFTIARSGSGLYVERIENTGEDIVVPPTTITNRVPVGTMDKASWENIFIALEVVFGVLTGVAGLAWIASEVLPEKKEDK